VAHLSNLAEFAVVLIYSTTSLNTSNPYSFHTYGISYGFNAPLISVKIINVLTSLKERRSEFQVFSHC